MQCDKLYSRKYYEENEVGFKSEIRSDHERILQLLHIELKDRVLDIGCGYGVLLAKIACKEKMGIESSDHAARVCRGKALCVIRADVEGGLPFSKGSFDIVIMNEVLEHLRNPKFVLKECFRILSPHGRLIITTPNRNFFTHDWNETHFSEMNTKELGDMIRRTGFNIIAHEVCGISFVYPVLDILVFKPFKFLKRKKIGVDLIYKGHYQAELLFLKPLLGRFRTWTMQLGTQQLLLSEKPSEA